MLIVWKFQGLQNQCPSWLAFEEDLQSRVCNPQEVQQAQLPLHLCLRDCIQAHLWQFNPKRSKHTMNTALKSCTSMPSSLMQFLSFLLFIFLLGFNFDMQFQGAGDHASSYIAILTQSRTIKTSSSHYTDMDTGIRNRITAWYMTIYHLQMVLTPIDLSTLRLSLSIQGVC